MRRHLDTCALTGVCETVHVDWDNPANLIIQEGQDLSDAVEAIKTMRDLPKGQDMRHIGEIPMVIYNQAVREGWADDPAAWRRWIKNPDNAMFKVHGD